MKRFLGRVALVTGGASGIGYATVHRLADEGATLIVVDIDGEGAAIAAKEVEGTAITVDLEDAAGVATALANVGPIDVLVNNAGTDRFAFFTDTDHRTWDHVLGVNLRGAMAVTRAVLDGMYERRRGTIVNVASEAGQVGSAGGAAYSASKAGLLGFTKAIAREGARYGVRSNAVAPGPVDTPMLTSAVAAFGPRGVALRQAMIDTTLLKRTGTPEEIAAAIAFLASDDASYITGHTLAVSGGVSLS